MPDFLAFLSFIPKLFGSKVILDLHDPSPEMLMTKFSDSKESKLIRLLKWQEKVSIEYAHIVITTNQSFVDRFISRGCPPNKITVVMNSPQESIFNKFMGKSQKKPDETKFILMYHGLILERYGLLELVDALELLKNKIPGLELRVYGPGEDVQVFLDKIRISKSESLIKYTDVVPIEEIAKKIPECDIGIIPNRLSPFTQINFPTRIFEYIHLKKPVIVPRTQGIKDYFDEESIFYFDAGNAKSLADAIFKVYFDPSKTVEVVDKGYKIYQKYKWENQSKNLLKIYEDLSSN
jgi:glycosyltransferase involved in cell wall biosynthesis